MQFHSGIFTLYSAYCAWGKELQFGVFNEKSQTHLIVKKFIKENNISISKGLDGLFSKDHPSYFVVRALRLNNNFKLTKPKADYEKPNNFYGNFDKLIADFFQNNNFGAIENEISDLYHIQIVKYLKPTKKIIKRTNKLLRINSIDLGLTQLLLIPNQIDRTRNGYGTRIGNTAYIIFSSGLSKKVNTNLIQHEYLHSIINPEFGKPKIKLLVKKTEHLKSSHVSGRAMKFYPKWEFILTEYVLRAVAAWSQSSRKREEFLRLQETDRGFIKIRKFVELEKNYLDQKGDFINYLPQLLESTLNTKRH